MYKSNHKCQCGKEQNEFIFCNNNVPIKVGGVTRYKKGIFGHF